MGGGGKSLRKGWTHEGERRRGPNACGGEGGHMKGRGGGGPLLVVERVDT